MGNSSVNGCTCCRAKDKLHEFRCTHISPNCACLSRLNLSDCKFATLSKFVALIVALLFIDVLSLAYRCALKIGLHATVYIIKNRDTKF